MHILSAEIRILHMIGSLGIGGSQAFIMNIYRKIDRSRVQFDFIVDSQKNNYYIDEIEDLGGKVYYFPKFNGKNYFKIRRFWKEFLTAHEEYRILHSHVRSYASIYLPIAKEFGVKTIIHSHSTSNGSGMSAFVKYVLQLPLRFQADYYMACSNEAGEWLFGKRVCRSERFRVINNAIDVDDYTFCNKKRKVIRDEFGLNDEFVLGYLARVTEPKNPLFVIDVMSELLKIIPDAKLLFVGDGELLSAVKERVSKFGINESVIFTGARTDVSCLLAAMDCYILPSIWEGLGISLVEAQATGLPCICSEGIQDEAIVTNLVERCSLSLGPKVWAQKITTLVRTEDRLDMSEIIKRAGFDVVENTRFLQSFYEKLMIL